MISSRGWLLLTKYKNFDLNKYIKDSKGTVVLLRVSSWVHPLLLGIWIIYAYPIIAKDLTYPKLSAQSIERVRNLLFDLIYALEESFILVDDGIHLRSLFFVLPILGIPDYWCAINAGYFAWQTLLSLASSAFAYAPRGSMICSCTFWL